VTAEEEMIGVNASALVASMADIEAGRDRTVLEDPSQSMGEVALAMKVELTVTAMGKRALPDQAA
jgi:hypothetical protein